MIMAASSKATEKLVPSAEEARAEILGHLETWRHRLADVDRGGSNLTLTREGILKHIDAWLDRLLDLRGA